MEIGRFQDLADRWDFDMLYALFGLYGSVYARSGRSYSSESIGCGENVWMES